MENNEKYDNNEEINEENVVIDEIKVEDGEFEGFAEEEVGETMVELTEDEEKGETGGKVNKKGLKIVKRVTARRNQIIYITLTDGWAVDSFTYSKGSGIVPDRLSENRGSRLIRLRVSSSARVGWRIERGYSICHRGNYSNMGTYRLYIDVIG